MMLVFKTSQCFTCFCPTFAFTKILYHFEGVGIILQLYLLLLLLLQLSQKYRNQDTKEAN